MAAYQASETQRSLHELIEDGSGPAGGARRLVRTSRLPEQLLFSDDRGVEPGNHLEHSSHGSSATALGGSGAVIRVDSDQLDAMTCLQEDRLGCLARPQGLGRTCPLIDRCVSERREPHLDTVECDLRRWRQGVSPVQGMGRTVRGPDHKVKPAT